MASVLGYWPWSSPIFLKLQVNFPITKTKYLAKYMKPGSLLHGLWVSFFLSDRIFQNLAPGTQVFLIFLEHRARVRERWVRVVQLQSQILSLFKMIFFFFFGLSWIFFFFFFFLAYHGFFFFFFFFALTLTLKYLQYGVPVMVHRKRSQLATMRLCVRSLASLSGSRI